MNPKTPQTKEFNKRLISRRYEEDKPCQEVALGI
jgi:hypothetical protein